ncbi:MAG TPA: Mur ligase family protein [Thermoplasmata archaeon]|nr:Mur ligase family protein [Thermoplasmata archaeon]
MPPEAYRTVLERLYARRRFGIRPGLEVVRSLLAELGDPQRSFPAVHITGSKGKGSVAALTAAALEAHGLSVGMFTSPHLAHYAERMRVGGRPIAPAAVIAGVERVERATEALRARGTIDRDPTFFEVTTAVAFDWFARRRVDVGVIEVGVGGRLDSTNVLDARVGVITTIELEHTELLGATLAAIAGEKSGILHPGMQAVVGALPPEALEVVLRTADRLGLNVWRLGREIEVGERSLGPDGQTVAVRVPGVALPPIELPLLGRFQAGNAALAVAATVRFLAATSRPVRPEAIVAGIGRVKWPGRLERRARRPELYFDVAHTPESARAVAESLGEIAPLAQPAESAILFGCLRGKNVARILDALAPLARTIVVVPVKSERRIPPAELRVAATGRFARVVEAPSAADGLRLARAATGPDGLTLVTGSDYLVGELLRPAESDEPDLSDPGSERPPGDRPVAPPGRAA